MKKILIALLLIVLCVPCACAENYSKMNYYDLSDKRQAVINELTKTNMEIGGWKKKNAPVPASLVQKEKELRKTLDEIDAVFGKTMNMTAFLSFSDMTISMVFKDKTLAREVRDQCGKASIDQVIKPEDIKRVDMITFSSKEPISSLLGVSFLVNCDFYMFVYSGKNLDDELGDCVWIKNLFIDDSSIEALPSWIGNLTNLESLSISNTNVSKLPDSIGNLKNLKYLNISNTKITELPDSIYCLNLETFYKRGLDLD